MKELVTKQELIALALMMGMKKGHTHPMGTYQLYGCNRMDGAVERSLQIRFWADSIVTFAWHDVRAMSYEQAYDLLTKIYEETS